MKIIITYASAGAGHFKAAKAIYSNLKEQHKELDVKLADVLQKTSFLFKVSYNQGYSFLVRHAPWLWRLAFLITYSKSLRLFTRPIASIINRLNTRIFSRILIQENPDFIVSTHFLPSEIAADLKTEQKITSKLITIVTDFGVHPFWVSEGTDTYVVASGFTKRQLLLEGIAENNIKELGIPIESKFLKEYNKEELFKKFNLQQNKFIVLIETGSFGIGPIEAIVDLLYKDVQILVVCAKNKRLYKRLKNKNYPDVKVLGFVNNMHELMAVSDIIITKPGGLSISESLAMDLLPIFIVPIPGQEKENIKALAHYGIGIYLEDINKIRDTVMGFRDHSEKLQEIKNSIRKIKKPFACQEICNVICQGSPGDSC